MIIYMFEDGLEDNDIEYDRTCQNCTFYYQDSDDWDYACIITIFLNLT